jgi:hypothetical protein
VKGTREWHDRWDQLQRERERDVDTLGPGCFRWWREESVRDASGGRPGGPWRQWRWPKL